MSVCLSVYLSEPLTHHKRQYIAMVYPYPENKTSYPSRTKTAETLK